MIAVLAGTAAASSSSTQGEMLQFKAGGHLLGFLSRQAYLAGLDHSLSVEFVGTNGVVPEAVPGSAPRQGGVAGADGRATTVAQPLATVSYRNLWPGIDLVYSSTKAGVAESTYHVAPGADVSRIRLRYNVPARKQPDGSLTLAFRSGAMIESAPVAWQEIGGKRIPVGVSFQVSGREIGFTVARYDATLPLTIDPTYEWHAFYGAAGANDFMYGLALDGSGNIYVAGQSQGSWSGPAGQAPLHAFSGADEIVVAKLDANGGYLWHTFYGSGYWEGALGGLTVDGSGNVYVAGYSWGTWNGPAPASAAPLNAFSSTSGESGDLVVLKLDTDGAYQWHTFYGAATRDDNAYGIAVDGSGNVAVAGTSVLSWNGPAPASAAPLHAHAGDADTFVLKLDAGGGYLWHTFYGAGGSIDTGSAVGVDASGNVYATGHSDVTWKGPGEAAPKHAFSGAGHTDAFVLKLDADGGYLWHTFYGSGTEDYSRAIAVDDSGGISITGSSAAKWTGPGGVAPRHAFNADTDIFVLKLDADGDYLWHTFYGSSTYEEGFRITEHDGSVYVSGSGIASWNAPALPISPYTGGDTGSAYVLKLNAANGSYVWHGFLGKCTYWNYGGSETSVALNGSQEVVVAGSSNCSWDGPGSEVPLNPHAGEVDFFVMKLTDVPLTVISPNGGETWDAGASQMIRWAHSAIPGAYVKIDLLKGGAFDRTLAAAVPKGAAGTGLRTVTIPATQDPGSDYTIRVASAANGIYQDTSDAPFTIKAPTVTVASPNGGETWDAGVPQRIQWTYTGNPGPYVRIELLKGGVLNRTLATAAPRGTAGAGSCAVKIPATQTPGTDYAIRVTSTKNASITDTSDADLVIKAPTIAVTSPNGGETWKAGIARKITWTYTGNPGPYVKVELLKGGTLKRTLATAAPRGTAGAGSLTATIPAAQAPGSDYTIRVTSTRDASITDTSNADFSISP
jgi:hypothetical protein